MYIGLTARMRSALMAMAEGVVIQGPGCSKIPHRALRYLCDAKLIRLAAAEGPPHAGLVWKPTLAGKIAISLLREIRRRPAASSINLLKRMLKPGKKSDRKHSRKNGGKNGHATRT